MLFQLEHSQGAKVVVVRVGFGVVDGFVKQVVGVVHVRAVGVHFGVVRHVVVEVVHFIVVFCVVFGASLQVARTEHLGGIFGVALRVVPRVMTLRVVRLAVGRARIRLVVLRTIFLGLLGVILITGRLGTPLIGPHAAGRLIRMRIAVTFCLGALQASSEP